MKDEGKTKEQLTREVEELRKRNLELEASEQERRKTEETLKEKEYLLKEAERIAKVGSWEMDIATGKSWWSDEFFRICGFEPGAIEPTAEKGMQLIHPGDRERAAREVQKAIEQGKEYNIEKRIVHPDGSVRTVISRGEIVFDNNNKPLKLMGTFLDITEVKKAEEEIRQLNEELEAKVKERTKQLEAANRKLRRLSTIDTLTGIANRRSFNEAIEKEWRRCIRSGKSLSLIMADIDFFKDYNDHYGHLEGDTCLKKVAGALKRALRRPGDFLARYGGEEFVALLPDTDSQGACLVAEAMLYNVKALGVPHAHSSVSERVTVSFGLATIVPLIDVKSSTLIKAADDALYEAKKQGRNRIEMQN